MDVQNNVSEYFLSDTNECLNSTLNVCSQKDNCINTDGSFNCSCSVGYKLDNDQRTCTGKMIKGIFILALRLYITIEDNKLSVSACPEKYFFINCNCACCG